MTGERFCSHCGERIPNDPEQHFCMFCGSFCMSSSGQANQTMSDEAVAYTTKKIRFCPYCRAEIVTGLKFCGMCGKVVPKAANTHAVTEMPKAVTASPKVDVPQSQTEVLQPEEDVLQPEEELLQPEEVGPQPETVQPAPSYTPPPKKKINTLLILAVTAVVLVTLAFVALVGLVVAISSQDISNSISHETEVVEDYGYSDEEDYEQDYNTYSDEEAEQDMIWKTQYDFACERLVTETDLVGLDAEDLRIMRNWIFARHGYIFKSQELNDYFNQFPWYNPRYTDVSSMLSDVEIKNAEFIKRHE